MDVADVTRELEWNVRSLVSAAWCYVDDHWNWNISVHIPWNRYGDQDVLSRNRYESVDRDRDLNDLWW